jgi:hypothetical protein
MTPDYAHVTMSNCRAEVVDSIYVLYIGRDNDVMYASDASQRWNIAYTYSTMKSILPGDGKASRR